MVHTIPGQLSAASEAVWFYLGKLAWPHPLLALYSQGQIDFGDWGPYPPMIAGVAVCLILWLYRESWSRPWFFAFAYYLVAMLPELELADSYVADHFQYLGSMGTVGACGRGSGVAGRLGRSGKQRPSAVLVAGVMLISGVLSWQQAWVYQNIETLWANTLANDPSNYLAYYDLGNALGKEGRRDEAIAMYQKALGLNPSLYQVYNNMGIILFERGQLNDALADFRQSLEINPDCAVAEDNIGTILVREGRIEEAIGHFQRSLSLEPTSARARDEPGIRAFPKGER